MRSVALALCLSVVVALPLRAGESAGGSYDLQSQGVGAGGNANGGVTESATSVASQGGHDESASNGSIFNSGLLGDYVTLQLAAFAPSTGAVTRDGMVIAVPSSATVGLSFVNPISTQSLVTATTVYLIYDHLGNLVNQPVSFSVFFDTSGRAAILPPGGWSAGATYQVEVGTGTVDLAGTPLAATLSTEFQATLDFSEENVVRALGDTQSTVRIPSNTLSGLGYVVFVADAVREPDRIDPSIIQSANAHAAADFGQAAPVRVVELNAYSNAGAPLSAFKYSPRLTLPYQDTSGNGTVDGTAGRVRVADLSLYALDPANRLWIRVPGSAVDTAGKTVGAPLPHFSVYSIMAAVDTDVSQAYAYPVPWRPYSSDSARYGTLAGGITFINLPQAGRLRIFTLSGLLVQDQNMDGSLKWVWDGRNRGGEVCASGTYLWLLESGGNKKTGKLMIIR